MTLDADSDTLAYLDALAEQVRELGPACLEMLVGALAPDPLVLPSVCAAAVALGHAPGAVVPEDSAMATRLVRAARRPPGASVMAATLAALELGEPADLEPDADPAEQVSRLDDLVQLGFLRELIDGEVRADIDSLLERNAALVLFEAPAFAHLIDAAELIANAFDLPDDHRVASFLDTVIAATGAADAPAWSADSAVIEAIVARDLSIWARLRERWSSVGRAVSDFFQVAGGPRVAHAASLDLAWPPGRLVLGQRDGDELGLVVVNGDVLVEWIGAHAPVAIIPVDPDGAPVGPALASTSGPLVGAHYWQFSTEACAAVGLDVDFVTSTWRVALTPSADVPSLPAPARLAFWHDVAPGSLGEALIAHAAQLASTHRAWSLHFAQEAARIRVPRPAARVGRAWFPVVFEGEAPIGALATVDSGGLTASDALAPAVRAWIGHLVGAPDHAALASLSVHFTRLPDVDARGASHELASAIAVVSALIERAPRRAPIVSGRLGEGPGEVLPIALAEAKRRVVASEGGDAFVRVVDAASDARPWLAELFGADWHPRLVSALGLDGAAHARAALRAWQRFSHGYSVLELAAHEQGRALSEAEAALVAGVDGVPRAHALWVRGAVRMHRGETVLAHADLGAARDLLMARPIGELDRFAVEECDAFMAIALVDSGRASDAVVLLTPDLSRLDAVAPAERDRRWHLVRVQVAGSLQRAHAGQGDIERAFVILSESLATSSLASERARSLGDLAELERRRGRASEARSLLARARQHLDDILDDGMRVRTERFIRLYEARAGAEPVDYPIAAPQWDLWPQPSEVLESLIDSPPGELAAWFEAHVASGVATLGTVWLLVLVGAAARALGHDDSVVPMMRMLASELLARGIDDATRLAALASDRPERVAAEWVRRTPY